MNASGSASIPGIGIAASKRNTMNAPRTKRTRARKVSSPMISFVLRQNASNILLSRGDGIARLCDGGACGRGYGNTLHGELLRQRSLSDYFDGCASTGVDDTALLKRFCRDLRAGVERRLEASE